MKRAELIRQIEKKGCLLIRHGARHDWYRNPRSGECQPVARHCEINEHLARHILHKLDA